MKLLLDTHAFIWWVSDLKRMTHAALAACRDPANTLYLSLASVWELQIKMQIGKLKLRLPLAEIIDDECRDGLVLVPIGIDDILALSALPPIHRDPFDRLLVAQAQRSGFHLVSGDPLVKRYGGSVLW